MIREPITHFTFAYYRKELVKSSRKAMKNDTHFWLLEAHLAYEEIGSFVIQAVYFCLASILNHLHFTCFRGANLMNSSYEFKPYSGRW